MSDESAAPERITRKEAARLARKKAYQRAKEWRKNDPRTQAFQAAQKVRRQEMNQLLKERRKEAKRAQAEEASKRREAERVEQARALLRLISR
jgi:hypothetical protein